MDARRQEIMQEIARRGIAPKAQSQQAVSEQDPNYDPFAGNSRTFGDVGRDLIQGMANARIASDKFMAPVTDPIRKMIPESMRFIPELKPHEFEGKNPDEMTQALTQYGLPLIAGGGDALKTVLLSALYGTTQGESKEAAKRSAQDTLLAGLLPAMGHQLTPIGRVGKSIIDYFRPEQEAKVFMKGLVNPQMEALTGGTSQENIETLAKRLQFAKQSAEREALLPKEQLMATEAKSTILPDIPAKRPNTKAIAEIFDKSATRNEMLMLDNEVKDYYQTGDIDKFMEEAEKIFDHPGLSEEEELKIESMLPFEKRKIAAGHYRATKDVTDPYSANGKLMELHDDYMKNPNFENSDELISAIKKQERKYEGTKEDVGIRKLEELKRNRKALEKDQEKFFETLPPEKQNLYREFREKYKINKEKYENKKTPTLTGLASGEHGGIGSTNVRSQFSGNLRQNVAQALQDIGPSGEGNILYNELSDLKPGNVDALAKRIAELKQTGGMQRYISPETESLMNNLQRRLKHRRYLGAGGLLAGAGGLYETNHPYAAATAGVSAIPVAVGATQLRKALLGLLKG